MIPRIEQKTEINKSNYLDLLKWIKNKRGKILYPERIICSRYFDNKDLQMYFDTVEGIVPRKKIRIRTYGSEKFISSDKKYSLEVKMTTEQARLKRTEDKTNLENLLVNGYYDKLYGFCHEILDISYTREYFIVNDIRVTIDKNIKYRLRDLNKNFKRQVYEDQNYVFEIKAGINTNLSFLLNNFDFPRSRFSKYERAVNSLLK